MTRWEETILFQMMGNVGARERNYCEQFCTLNAGNDAAIRDRRKSHAVYQAAVLDVMNELKDVVSTLVGNN